MNFQVEKSLPYVVVERVKESLFATERTIETDNVKRHGDEKF